jgi:type IV pilus assembly protein PilB
MRWPPPGARQRIGEMLLDEGLIRPDDLRAALELQRRTGLRLDETAVTLGFVSSFDVARVLARRLEVDFVDLETVDVDPVVAGAVPEEVARRYRALAIERTDAGVVVVMCDPRDVFAIDDLRVLLGGPVLPALADPGQIDDAITRAWSGPMHARGPVTLAAGETLADADASDLDPPESPSERPATSTSTPIAASIAAPADTLVHSVLAEAIDRHATDAHFEPGPDGVQVRFRIDGVLRRVDGAPLTGHSTAMSVIKILAGIDGSRGDRPHRGHFSVTHGDRAVDVTLSTLPTSDGEVAVLHIDDETPPARELGALGLTPEQRAAFDTALHLAHGLVVAAGPSGSGRRTTVEAALAALNRPDRSVVALDPASRGSRVRDPLDGVQRVRIDPRSPIAAAGTIRSAIQADADVILAGTLEDPETTRAAVDAARVGRLVLATVESPRAAAIPLRLVDLGIEPFVVTSALTCCVAQRLVRQLCTRCSEPYEPDVVEREHLGLPDELIDTGSVRRAVGCEHCGGTGYRGRLAIYEVMPMTDTVARVVAAGGTSRAIERWAVADGMDTLRMSAFRRVADGVLGLDELTRVIP